MISPPSLVGPEDTYSPFGRVALPNCTFSPALPSCASTSSESKTDVSAGSERAAGVAAAASGQPQSSLNAPRWQPVGHIAII